MAGNKCSYVGCNNTTRSHPGLRKFSFPISNKPRCQKWLINSGNADLMLNFKEQDLKHRFICGDHFEKKYLLGIKLTTNAIPINFKDSRKELEAESTSSKTYQHPDKPSTSAQGNEEWNVRAMLDLSPSIKSPKNHSETVRILTPSKQISPAGAANVVAQELAGNHELLQVLQNIPSSPKAKIRLEMSFDDTPRKKRQKLELEEKGNKLQGTKSQVKKQTWLTSTIHPSRNVQSLPSFPRVLTRMQLHHKARTAWNKEEQTIALTLYYKSPSTYRFLRSKGMILPSPSTIKMWLMNFKTKPGYNSHIFKRIKTKASTMSNREKHCMLLFDEITIKKNVDYAKKDDMLEGVEDLGEFGRRPVPAKQALVLMLRGIYSDWKVPIAYYFSETGVRADILEKIVFRNIQYINRAGLNIQGIVCDQSTTNQKFIKNLKVTPEKPYFIIKDRKYFSIYDVPHLIKNIRNNLLVNDYILNGNHISWSIIKKVYGLDKASQTARALVKLTDRHMSPNNFEKMSVRLATQVFSHSVASAIRTCIATKQLNSEKALPTADFVEIIDNLFDALNSKYFCSKKTCNLPLKEDNQDVTNAMKTGRQVMKSISKIGNDGKLSRPSCFDGMIQSINAIEMLHNTNKTEELPYILTGRLNQDPLENLFSVFRQRGGYNRNPTVRTFNSTFKSRTVVSLMKPPENSNCEPDEDENIFDKYRELDQPHLEEENAESISSDLSGISILSDTSKSSSDREDTTLEDCSIVYFGGYLVKKLLEKFQCSLCDAKYKGEQDLTNENELLILHKNFNVTNPCNLKTPSQLMKSLTKIAMTVISKKTQRVLEFPKFVL